MLEEFYNEHTPSNRFHQVSHKDMNAILEDLAINALMCEEITIRLRFVKHDESSTKTQCFKTIMLLGEVKDGVLDIARLIEKHDQNEIACVAVTLLKDWL